VIRVVVADDHAVVRHGLREILGGEGDIEVAGEVSDFPGLVDQVRQEPCDVVVMDLAMPGGSGLDVLKRLRARRPELAVLVLSVHPEEQFAVRLLRAGAAGYLDKATAATELVGAIRRVAAGKRYVSSDLADRLADALGDEAGPGPRHERLSDREFEVLQLLGRGLSVGDIAEHLKLSAKTVSTYRSRLLDKMEMDSNAELIRYAMDHDLVE
jgi:DNA-binding NarL/FixJ family response regulator